MKPTKRQDGTRRKKHASRKRGRPKALGISVHSLNEITRLLERYRLPAGILTYRSVAEELTGRSGVTITVGTVYRLAHGIEPKQPRVRAALELPAFESVKVCEACGVVHVKPCPASRKPGKPRAPRLDRRRLALELLGQLYG